PVAGDADDPLAPTYGAFAGLLAPVPVATGQRPGQSLDRSGSMRLRPELAAGKPEIANARYDEVMGHNIPRVFVDFMARSGSVNTPAGRRTEQLVDALALIGRPISDAYWADVQMDGRVQPVLVQLYERRVLTYNPANPAAFRVEMGNVGIHYYEWRYGAIAPRSDRREQLLDHFEGDGQALNGNYWFSFDDRPDGGVSSASSGLIGPGALDSVHAMRLNYTLSDATAISYAALALNLDRNGAPLDLRPYAAVGFWARGTNARFTVMVSSGLSDEPLASTFVAPGEWGWVEVPLDTLRQSPGKEIDRNQALANATRIQFRPADRPSGGFLDVDDLVLINGAAQPTVQDTGLPLIDDFDDGNLTTALNTEWFTYDDRDEGGGSTGELALVSPGANGSRSALRFRGAFYNQWGGEPFLGTGAPLAPDGQTFDLSDYKTIRISIKPDSHRYRLQINSALIKDRNQYGITLDAPEGEWNTLYIPLKLLTPLNADDEQPIDLKLACTQLQSIIITPLDKPAAFQLFIDDVSLVR
ncbi:MAG: CIA30 family protein, partial [Chloroflexales bacterium]|nr:CIA30 family protein [Chloroflexales bacterium]